MLTIDDAPDELASAIKEFFPPEAWNAAASVAQLESGFSAFAIADTTTPDRPCGTELRTAGGVRITAELSLGWFQINACNLPEGWNPWHLYNTRHNVGTAHKLWQDAGGWYPWYYSATRLGLI